MAETITAAVARNIGQGILSSKEYQHALLDALLDVRLAQYFKPLVRTALAEALELEDPELIGPELIDEGLQAAITALYLARKWLAERIPQMASDLRAQFSEQYDGLDSDEIAEEVARNALITRDSEVVLANAVRDGLLRQKA